MSVLCRNCIFEHMTDSLFPGDFSPSETLVPTSPQGGGSQGRRSKGGLPPTILFAPPPLEVLEWFGSTFDRPNDVQQRRRLLGLRAMEPYYTGFHVRAIAHVSSNDTMTRCLCIEIDDDRWSLDAAARQRPASTDCPSRKYRFERLKYI